MTKKKDSNLINSKTFVKKLKYKPTKEDQTLLEVRELNKDIDYLLTRLDVINSGLINDNIELKQSLKALSNKFTAVLCFCVSTFLIVDLLLLWSLK